jgi:large-conductance mechanosensitive channel
MGSKCIFLIKKLVEIIYFSNFISIIVNFVIIEFPVKLIVLYNGQLSISYIQKLYQIDII